MNIKYLQLHSPAQATCMVGDADVDGKQKDQPYEKHLVDNKEQKERKRHKVNWVDGVMENGKKRQGGRA